MADLAFYAGRFMDSCNWEPFLKAAFERNPVSIEFFREMDAQLVYGTLQSWPDELIYDGNRLALPDEVVNFRRGDGIEKAITLANVLKNRTATSKITMETGDRQVILHSDHHTFTFNTGKEFPSLPDKMIL